MAAGVIHVSITVGDIRKAIEGLPDQAPVLVYVRSRNPDGGAGGVNMGQLIETQAVVREPHTPRIEIDI